MHEIFSQIPARDTDEPCTGWIVLAVVSAIGKRGAFTDEITQVMLRMQKHMYIEQLDQIPGPLGPDSHRVRQIAAAYVMLDYLDDSGVNLQITKKGEEHLRKNLNACLPDERSTGQFWALVLQAVSQKSGDETER